MNSDNLVGSVDVVSILLGIADHVVPFGVHGRSLCSYLRRRIMNFGNLRQLKAGRRSSREHKTRSGKVTSGDIQKSMFHYRFYTQGKSEHQ